MTDLQGVILAAGGGSRLGQLSRNRSKAMMPIVGKPIVERIMDDMAACGIDDFFVVVSPGDTAIEDHFHAVRRSNFNVRIVYQPERLGMADALSQAAPLISGNFMLSACDNLVPLSDFRRVVNKWKSSPSLQALLTLIPVSADKVPSMGIVAMDGAAITRIVEKPSLEDAPSNIASTPLYCFSPKILDYLSEVPASKRGERELQDAIQMLIYRDGSVEGLMLTNRMTLTSPNDLLNINMHYLKGVDNVQTDKVGPNSNFVPPLYIESGVTVGANCTVGPNVYVESGCEIRDGAVVRDAVLLKGAVVEAGEKVELRVV